MQLDILAIQIEITPKPQRSTIQREKTICMYMTDDETNLTRHTQDMTEAINAGEADATLIVRKTDYKGKDLSPDVVRRMFIDGKLKFGLEYDSEMMPDIFELKIIQKLIKETYNNLKVVNDKIYKKDTKMEERRRRQQHTNRH